MIHGIHHPAISTKDMTRALAFYCDVLGFEEVKRFGWPKGYADADELTGLKDSAATCVMLKKGNSFLEVFEFTSPAPKQAEAERPVCDHGITHLCLYVSDMDHEYERLQAAGMTFHSEPKSDGNTRMAYGRDPDGNVVELLEVINEQDPALMKI